MRSGFPLVGLANGDPHAIAVVAMSTAMVPPPVLFAAAPAPVVTVDTQPKVWAVAGLPANSPTITVAITNNCRRRCVRREGQRAGRDREGSDGKQKSFA